MLSFQGWLSLSGLFPLLFFKAWGFGWEMRKELVKYTNQVDSQCIG